MLLDVGARLAARSSNATGTAGSREFSGSFRNILELSFGPYKNEGVNRRPNTFLGELGDPAAPPPRYVERYPRLIRREMLAGIKAGRPMCVWLHPGAERGWGLASLVEGGVRLTYRIYPFYGQGTQTGDVLLRFGRVALGQGRSREMFVCPACEGNVGTLIFFRGWKCQHCQKLAYRSSSVGSSVRRTERERELEAELSHGRPGGVHEKTMQKKRGELEALKAKLKRAGRRYAVNVEDRHIFQAEWVDAERCVHLAGYPVSR